MKTHTNRPSAALAHESSEGRDVSDTLINSQSSKESAHEATQWEGGLCVTDDYLLLCVQNNTCDTFKLIIIVLKRKNRIRLLYG